MSSNGSVTIRDQWKSFQESDTEREKLFKTLVEKIEALDKDLANKTDDLESERKNRRDLQAEQRKLTRKVEDLEAEKDHDPLTVVLIDGDQIKFHDTFLQAGSDGGGSAAAKLLQAVRMEVTNGQRSQNGNILVHIFANADGLSKSLISEGTISRPNDVYRFIQAFNGTQPLCSFVDVGYGKERADHKIHEFFRLFMSNQNCKRIFFAGCGDFGYLNMFDPVKHDQKSASRITLIEVAPLSAAYRALNMKIVSFPEVFRSEDTDTRAPPNIDMSSRHTHRAGATSVSTSPSPDVDVPVKSPSWANISTAGKDSLKNIDIASNSASAQERIRSYMVNKDNIRVDPSCPKYDPIVGASLRRKAGNEKFCNSHYLDGECIDHRRNCSYIHDTELTKTELRALTILARKIKCDDEGWCQNFRCFRSHHCPSGPSCRDPKCRWKDTVPDKHDMDTKPTMRIFENNISQILT